MVLQQLIRNLTLLIVTAVLPFFPTTSFGTVQDTSQNVGISAQKTASDWVELGCKLSLSGESEQAIEAYHKAIDLDPQYENAHLALATSLSKFGKGAEQIDALYSAHQLIPASPAILQNLVTALAQAGRDREAVDMGQKYLGLQPRDTSALCIIGAAYLRLKQNDDAIVLFAKALVIDDTLPFAWLSLGMAYHILGRSEDGLAAVQRVLDINPKDQMGKQAWIMKVGFLMMLGRTREGAEEIDREIGLNPDNPYAFFMRSLMKLTQQNPEEAIADLAKGLELPGDLRLRAVMYGQMGLCQIKLSRYEAAIQSLDKSIELVENAPAYALLATAYFYTGSFEEAIEYFDKAINSNDLDLPLINSSQFKMQAFSNLTLCLIGLGRWQDAEKTARYAVQLGPGALNPHMNLAMVLVGQNRKAEAESELRACVKLGIADWKTYLFLGGLYLEQKKLTDAVPAFRQALKLQPENPVIMNNLGYTLLELNTNLKEALDLIKRAIKGMPSNTAFRDSLGWAYFKTGDLVGAERELLQAAKANPNSPAILEHLGDLYRKMERKPDAVSYWRAALVLARDEDAKARLNAKITGP
jgi:tetratricopeptide (TPR) repeat protein